MAKKKEIICRHYDGWVKKYGIEEANKRNEAYKISIKENNYKYKLLRLHGEEKGKELYAEFMKTCPRRKGADNPAYGKSHKEYLIETIGEEGYEAAKKLKAERSREVTKRAVETGEIYSRASYGKANGMYGKSFYGRWVEKYGVEEANCRMQAYKEKHSKISSGKGNPMYGKPPGKGSGRGYSGWYNGWYFRSFLELSFMVNVIEKYNLKWESAEKGHGIKYKHKGTDRTYRADFLIENKYMVEVKPRYFWGYQEIKDKKKAAEKYCKTKNLKYKLISAKSIKNDVLVEWYKTKKIVLNTNCLDRFKRNFL